jgi:hypothetical protein
MTDQPFEPDISLFLATQEDFNEVMGMAKGWNYIDPMAPTRCIYPRMFVATKELKDDKTTRAGLAYCPILVPFNEHREKRACMFSMGRSFYQRKLVPVAAAFAAEAWMGSWAKGSKDRVEPRNQPDRQEKLVVFGGTIDDKFKALWFTPIHRDAQASISLGGPFEEAADEVEIVIFKHFYEGFFSLALKQQVRQN